MLDPFRLFGRLVLAIAKIFGYSIAFGTQALWHVLHGSTDRVGDAIGEFGKAVTDAVAAVFE